MKKIGITLLLSLAVLIPSYYSYTNKIEESAAQDLKAYNAQLQEELDTRVSKIEELEASVETANSKQLQDVSLDLRQQLTDDRRPTIVFLGDSTTEQNKYTNGKDGHVSIVRNKLNSIAETKIVNSGVSGDTLERMFKRVENDVLRHKPDVVVVSSGINDAALEISNDEFRKNLNGIMQLIRDNTDAQIVFRTSSLTQDKNINSRIVQEFNPIAKQVAEDHNAVFADMSDYYNGSTEENLPEFMTDVWHPNEKGQEVISDFVLYTLLKE